MADTTPDRQKQDSDSKSNEGKQAAETQEEEQQQADAVSPPVENVSPEEMAQFITTIKNPEQQVGEHVVAALQHPDTVAVLTTVVVGPAGHRHIVSAALNPQQVAQVNALLQQSMAAHEEEEPCVGFHCLIKPKAAASPSDPE